MIIIKKLKKIYNSNGVKYEALHGIDLEIEQGEFVAIMGRSGAGKTTLLNIIGCIDHYDRGTFTFCGVDMKNLKDGAMAKLRNSKIGFVMQDFALINHKSVLFNVMLPLFFDKTSLRKMKPLAERALSLVGLTGVEKKKVCYLSGGQKQRVAIARAIVKQPDLILADEPTGSLDSSTGLEIMELLEEMNRNGLTVIVVTHDEMVAGYCKRKIVLCDGNIISDTKFLPDK